MKCMPLFVVKIYSDNYNITTKNVNMRNIYMDIIMKALIM